MRLNVRQAKAEEIDFAWSLYGDFVRENVFSGQAGRPGPDKWIASEQRHLFSDYWNSTGAYIIEVDDNTVGWMAAKISDSNVVVENIFIVSDWQRKGIAERIVKEMTPEWRSRGLTVDVHVLKDGPATRGALAVLNRLGFKPASDLAEPPSLTAILRTN